MLRLKYLRLRIEAETEYPSKAWCHRLILSVQKSAKNYYYTLIPCEESLSSAVILKLFRLRFSLKTHGLSEYHQETKTGIA
ncbi:MAG: hypothetical protein ACTS73_08710 [Arsenophonus sp. NEOnobi-MAG3]